MRNTPITDELAREFAGKRLSSREAGAVWSLCRDLERELEEARKQRDKWKANHDNQVAINRTLRDRPDLGERAKLVDALTKQRDALAGALKSLCRAIISEEPHGITGLLKQSEAFLSATKGGSHE
jgi:hypothetical protein